MTTPYRVYIAAASVPSEIERVERWAAQLKEIGVEIVSTWPQNIRDVGTANPRDATREQRMEWAETCADQVAMANALWLMCPPLGVTTRGAWFELGIAYACNMPIVCSGDTEQTIFTALVEEWSGDEGAFSEIKGLANDHCSRRRMIDDACAAKRTKAVRK